MNDAKTEYFAQEQHYHNNISEYYNERLEEVNNLETNQIFFSIYDASDNLSKNKTEVTSVLTILYGNYGES